MNNMTPQLSQDVERFVTSEPTGAVKIEGTNGAVYWVLTEEAMNIKQYVQHGIDQADRGETTPWDSQEIIEEGRRRQNQRNSS